MRPHDSQNKTNKILHGGRRRHHHPTCPLSTSRSCMRTAIGYSQFTRVSQWMSYHIFDYYIARALYAIMTGTRTTQISKSLRTIIIFIILLLQIEGCESSVSELRLQNANPKTKYIFSIWLSYSFYRSNDILIRGRAPASTYSASVVTAVASTETVLVKLNRLKINGRNDLGPASFNGFSPVVSYIPCSDRHRQLRPSDIATTTQHQNLNNVNPLSTPPKYNER